MNPVAERRLRQFRGRQQVRAWDYRQRDLARGVWLRLRRALAGAAEIYAVSADVAQRLADEGFATLPVGGDLTPPKPIVVLSPERALSLEHGQRLEPRLNAELLTAPALVLVPFPPPAPVR